MPRGGNYETGTDEGVVTRFQRGVTKNGREFASFVVNGQEYSVWDPDLQSQAQGYDGMLVQIQWRGEVGSKYRSATAFTPMLEPTPKTTQGGQAIASGLDPDIQIRIAALKAATLTVGPVGQDKVYIVANVAREYEAYLLGMETGKAE